MHTRQESERDDTREKSILEMLNTTLALTIAAALRYKHHAHAARQVRDEGVPIQYARSVSVQFFEDALHKETHADQLAERIVALGGEPDFNPSRIALFVADRRAERADEPSARAGALVQMVKDALGAEAQTIEYGVQLLGLLGEEDPTTRRVLEQILDRFEADASELRKLLCVIDERRAVRGERRKGDRRKPANADRRSATRGERRAEGQEPQAQPHETQGRKETEREEPQESPDLAGDGIVDDQMTG